MAAAAREAGVPVVTGDTKVVEQGKGDGVFITTTGVGVVPPGVHIAGDRARPGDRILVSGTLGDHGMAVMSQREALAFGTDLSPTPPRCTAWWRRWSTRCPSVHVLRDPTRGGLATTLNEIAAQSGVGMLHRRSRDAGAAPGGGGLRIPRPGPAVRGQRRQAGRHRAAPSRPTGCWPTMRAHPLGGKRRDDRRGAWTTRTTSCR